MTIDAEKTFDVACALVAKLNNVTICRVIGPGIREIEWADLALVTLELIGDRAVLSDARGELQGEEIYLDEPIESLKPGVLAMHILAALIENARNWDEYLER